ncbi:hypothetical protein AAE478_008718 [Parahypoxylon ruwenzoriense]
MYPIRQNSISRVIEAINRRSEEQRRRSEERDRQKVQRPNEDPRRQLSTRTQTESSSAAAQQQPEGPEGPQDQPSTTAEHAENSAQAQQSQQSRGQLDKSPATQERQVEISINAQERPAEEVKYPTDTVHSTLGEPPNLRRRNSARDPPRDKTIHSQRRAASAPTSPQRAVQRGRQRRHPRPRPYSDSQASSQNLTRGNSISSGTTAVSHDAPTLTQDVATHAEAELSAPRRNGKAIENATRHPALALAHPSLSLLTDSLTGDDERASLVREMSKANATSSAALPSIVISDYSVGCGQVPIEVGEITYFDPFQQHNPSQGPDGAESHRRTTEPSIHTTVVGAQGDGTNEEPPPYSNQNLNSDVEAQQLGQPQQQQQQQQQEEQQQWRCQCVECFTMTKICLLAVIIFIITVLLTWTLVLGIIKGPPGDSQGVTPPDV